MQIDSSTSQTINGGGLLSQPTYSSGNTSVLGKDDFLKTHCSARWIKELNTELKKILSRNEKILSLGSGIGEHEVLLHRAFFLAARRIGAAGIYDDGRSL